MMNICLVELRRIMLEVGEGGLCMVNMCGPILSNLFVCQWNTQNAVHLLAASQWINLKN